MTNLKIGISEGQKFFFDWITFAYLRKVFNWGLASSMAALNRAGAFLTRAAILILVWNIENDRLLIFHQLIFQDWSSSPCFLPSSFASSPLGKAEGNPFCLWSSNIHTSCSDAVLSWYIKDGVYVIFCDNIIQYYSTWGTYKIFHNILTIFLASERWGWGNSVVANRGSACVWGFQ